MTNLSVRLIPETLRSRDSATFTGSYQTLGTPLLHPAAIFKIVNNSTMLVTVSLNGTTDHDVAPAGSFYLYDCASNATREGGLYIPQGTQVYIKGSAGTGSVYLVVYYAGP